MGLLERYVFGGDLSASYGPTDDYWYQPVGVTTDAGLRVDEAGAKKLSAWFRGRDLLASTLAMLPLQVFARLPDDEGAEVAKDHPAYFTLHDEPNEQQDTFEWRIQRMYHLIDCGKSFDFRVPKSRGSFQLVPIDDPRDVTMEKLSSGRVRYKVRDNYIGRSEIYSQDEIFHLRAHTEKSGEGRGILEYARNSLGGALAIESYSQRVFSKGVLNGGVIETPARMDDAAGIRMAKSFVTASGEWHMPKVLEQGAKWVESKMTPEDAQMLLSKQHSVDDVARWLGVPRHMLDNSDPSFGNAEQFNQNFVTFSLGKWLRLWEAAINRQLITQSSKYFAEFTRDALVRADILARWQAYAVAVTTGTFTRNEVRGKENMRKLDGLDEPLTPANITGSQTPKPTVEGPKQSAQATVIATSAAARLLRKEVAALQKLAVTHAAKNSAWEASARDFYAKHGEAVQQTLGVTAALAKSYCDRQLLAVLADLNVLHLWGTTAYASEIGAWALAIERAA